MGERLEGERVEGERVVDERVETECSRGKVLSRAVDGVDGKVGVGLVARCVAGKSRCSVGLRVTAAFSVGSYVIARFLTRKECAGS